MQRESSKSKSKPCNSTPCNLCAEYPFWLMYCLGHADNLCWWMHWGRGQALAHEALLLLRVRDHPRRPALHHEGWTATLLQLLRVPLRRVLWRMWRTHRYITCFLLGFIVALSLLKCTNTWTCFSYTNIIKKKKPPTAIYCKCGCYHLCEACVAQLWRGGVSAVRCGWLLSSQAPVTVKACVSEDAPMLYPDGSCERWLLPLAGEQSWWNVFVLSHKSSDHAWASDHKCFPSA